MRTFLLAVFSFFLSVTHAYAVSPQERVWVIGPRGTEYTEATTISALDSTGNVVATLPGQDTIDYLPQFSVSVPGSEFWVSLNRYLIGTVTEKGLFKPQLPAKIDGPFYVGNDNKVYRSIAGSITKTTILPNGTFKEEFLLQTGSSSGINNIRKIAVDVLGRVYVGNSGFLWRYNPATQEVLGVGPGFPTSLATYKNVAFCSKQQDGLIYKIEDDGTYHVFSGITPVHFVATDDSGNIIAVVGTAPSLTLWKITPDGAATPFSNVVFKEVYGLGITHGQPVLTPIELTPDLKLVPEQ